MDHAFNSSSHVAWLRAEALAQFKFFSASLNPHGGFHVLGLDGAPLVDDVQELHTTTRLVHSYCLGKEFGFAGSESIIDQGVRQLLDGHRDARNGGYNWAVGPNGVVDGRKLAYGHVFVLLAAAAAMHAGHADAQELLRDVDSVIDQRFWDDEAGRLVDEYTQDWSELRAYRGMNANMHGVEAMLTAFEVTGNEKYLDRAGRILTFFFDEMAPAYGWSLPEHFTTDWKVDEAYAGNPMFQPAGTTPGHSFELGRLLVQFWDLKGRSDPSDLTKARRVVYQALVDAWDQERGGFVYTLNFDGTQRVKNRYWWPVTEAIGALATLIKVDAQPEDREWYQRCWSFAQTYFMDETGGWVPEIDADGKPDATQFAGKPDIYHAIQATLLPLVPGVSRLYEELGSAT